MFGTNNPFNQKPQQNVLREFDSAAVGISKSINTLLTSSIREELSFIEHIRETALHIVSDLVDAVIDNTLDENELPTDRLDLLILDALDVADDENGTLENALVASIDDVLSSFGIDDSVIVEIFSDNIEAADAAIEVAAEQIIANMPDEGDALDQFIREFIYGNAEEKQGFDSQSGKENRSYEPKYIKSVDDRKVYYKANIAIRSGLKKIVNKRLSAKRAIVASNQEIGLKKTRLKERSASFLRKRMRSLLKGKKIGFNK
ncbi:MAG: hypothetical protein BGN93_02385 [Acinetobacter sp. 39-4]|nr:MAG: hypothetical protein BGN93_02385 [Acinetobacter sp. 39-4]OJU92177.1 MAG: hypothetical protein BGO19_12470 [Acinetobacter sp. 38-8]